jgi:hypothetical protein
MKKVGGKCKKTKRMEGTKRMKRNEKNGGNEKNGEGRNERIEGEV